MLRTHYIHDRELKILRVEVREVLTTADMSWGTAVLLIRTTQIYLVNLMIPPQPGQHCCITSMRTRMIEIFIKYGLFPTKPRYTILR